MVSAGAGLHTAVAGPETRADAPAATAATTATFGFGSRIWGAHARTASTAGWGQRLRGRVVEVSSITKVKPAAPAPARVLPVEGPITGVFGEPRGHGPHLGLDLDGETGDPIRAAAAGTVVATGGLVGWSGYGTVVVIDHGAGVQTLYAHLSAVSAQAGQIVAPGATIGAMGTSGFVTGSHLHFEVRLNGQPVDPVAWLTTPAR